MENTFTRNTDANHIARWAGSYAAVRIQIRWWVQTTSEAGSSGNSCKATSSDCPDQIASTLTLPIRSASHRCSLGFLKDRLSNHNAVLCGYDLLSLTTEDPFCPSCFQFMVFARSVVHRLSLRRESYLRVSALQPSKGRQPIFHAVIVGIQCVHVA